MKNFFSSMLGALAALVIFTLGGAVLMLGVVGIFAALGSDRAPKLERGSYVVFDLSANVTDSPPRLDWAALGSEREKTLQLRHVTRALRAAASDDRIAGVFIKGSVTPMDYGSGYATMKELRAALAAVRAAGKPVKAYLTYATTRDFYLASIASELALDPYGMIVMPGLASEPVFFAGAFEKYGIGIQVTRVGKYKSFIEPFTRQDMSPENRQQTQQLLDDVWTSLIDDISQGRGVARETVQGLVDAEGVIRPEIAHAANLVDRIAYIDEVIDDLKQETGRRGSKEPFKQIALADYADIAPEPASSAKPAQPDGAEKSRGRGRIAVVYAEGDIVDGEGNNSQVGGVRFSRELRRLRQDDEVKAIVLRVNSPGGSASASEAIQREVWLARQVKPVVVSMGSYAASGGYWIAAYGDRIFAEPSTITGSIGVFGVQFDVQRLANNMGITFDSVKTGKFADAITIARPKTDEELEVFQRLVDWLYDQFIAKIVDARKLDRSLVEEIAQGRVWSGTAALNLGLVDELGGLDAALAYAAGKAGLGDNYRVTEYPQKKDLAQAILEFFGDINPAGDAKIRSGVVNQIFHRAQSELQTLQSFNDRAGLYARLPITLTVR